LPKIDDTFFPARAFLRNSFGKTKNWVDHEDISIILVRGIVLRVDNNVDNGDGAYIIPPGSIQAKVIGEETSSQNPYVDVNKWFVPFFPIHNISIPEIGEEVWILRESDSLESQGAWVSRVSDTNFINKSLARDNQTNLTPIERYGFPFAVEDIAQEVTQTTTPIYSIPFYPGDVIQQGRSDTYIRQSVNPKNKEGVLEIGIKERRLYNLTSSRPILTKVKSRHAHLSDINVGDVVSLPFANETSTEENKTVILNEADTILNVSLQEDSASELNRVVLGDKQLEWLKSLLATLDSVHQLNNLLAFVLFSHNHAVPEITIESDRVTVSIGEDETSFNVTSRVPSTNTGRPQTLFFDSQAVVDRINASKELLEGLEETINDHLSNHQYVN
jgi:hypothetical protein